MYSNYVHGISWGMVVEVVINENTALLVLFVWFGLGWFVA